MNIIIAWLLFLTLGVVVDGWLVYRLFTILVEQDVI